ncbi:MAG: GAF and ANTAR domain-containing protein [Streptosporangiaceae bacterium]
MDQELLSDTFVDLADTMVADFDVIDFLHLLTDRSVQLLGASAAGVMLADPRGQLRLVAASSEAVRVLEIFQLEGHEGPCMETIRTGQPIVVPDLNNTQQRWPRFTPAALRAGFAAVHALPMRLREQVLGGLNLFRDQPGAFDPADMRIGQALADTATIGLLHERNFRRSEIVGEQLQAALSSRIVIEQAKGKLAERLGLDMDTAFSTLRSYARDRNMRLSDLARALIDGGAADFADLASSAPDLSSQ